MKSLPFLRTYATDTASSPGDLAIDADRILIGVRRTNPGIQFYLTGIPHDFDARRFPDDGGPGPTRVNGGDLTGQHALAEPSGIGAQHGPANGVELDDDSHARRNDVPRIHRAPALDGPTGLLQQQVVFRHVLTDGAAVVEAQTWIDRDAAPQSDGIAHEQRPR